jgi:hypothetical protein
VATFTDPGGAEANDGSHYSASLNWGDGSATTAGTITFDGVSSYTVSGSHTYAAPNAYTIRWTILHEGISTPGQSLASVTSLGVSALPTQHGGSNFWTGSHGQALIQSWGGGAADTQLSAWLSSRFPNLYGAKAGSHNLTGLSNAQVAAFDASLVGTSTALDAEVLATALNIYATTLSYGGTAGQAYGFTVTSSGLGACAVNVGSNGAPFGVANGTILNVFQLLVDANNAAVGGVLWNGVFAWRSGALTVFGAVDELNSSIH